MWWRFFLCLVGYTHERIRNRESDETLQWCLDRSIVLTKELAENNLEDFTIDTSEISIEQVVDLIIQKWD